MKQSIFEASEAPKQWEGTISKKRRPFHWFSRNSELEATWISLIGWPHKMSITYWPCLYSILIHVMIEKKILSCSCHILAYLISRHTALRLQLEGFDFVGYVLQLLCRPLYFFLSSDSVYGESSTGSTELRSIRIEH